MRANMRANARPFKRDLKPYIAVFSALVMIGIAVQDASAAGNNVHVTHSSGVVVLLGGGGADGADGADGIDGIDGIDGTDGMDGISGISLTAALNSFDVAGVGVGVSGNSDGYEVSIGIGTTFSTQGHMIMGVTHEVNTDRTIGTVGLGWSF